MQIELLINQYKETVASETDASLRSCEILYELQSELLEQCGGNPNNTHYKNVIVKFRKEVNISRTQFMKDIAVGRALTQVYASNNEIRCLTKTQIYKQHCKPQSTSELVKSPDKKISYKDLAANYNALLVKCQELEQKLVELSGEHNCLQKEYEAMKKHSLAVFKKYNDLQERCQALENVG